jgi:hypothetical protein
MGQKGSKKGKRREFERMLSNALLETPASPVWERAGYRFTFGYLWENCTFFWKENRIYITSCEALHLYQRLVLGKKLSACTSRLALYGMRKRLGRDFLQEYLPTHVLMKRTGRKSGLARELDGSYYKHLFDKYQKGDT